MAQRIGYPVVVRPSYVLGGRAMAIVDDEEALRRYMVEALSAAPERPILIDQFLEDAFEVDVDAVCDGERLVIGGIMQHIEEAGIHSGDSACVLPPYKISSYHLNIIARVHREAGPGAGRARADERAVRHQGRRGLRAGGEPARQPHRALRRQGDRRAAGQDRGQGDGGQDAGRAGLHRASRPSDGFFVKEAVLPWKKFTGIDALLGPEMRSTGEVMGHAASFGHAFAKSQMGAGAGLPQQGGVLITVNDFDKGSALKIARDLHRLGFDIYATAGTGAFFTQAGLPVTILDKGSSGAVG